MFKTVPCASWVSLCEVCVPRTSANMFKGADKTKNAVTAAVVFVINFLAAADLLNRNIKSFLPIKSLSENVAGK